MEVSFFAPHPSVGLISVPTGRLYQLPGIIAAVAS